MAEVAEVVIHSRYPVDFFRFPQEASGVDKSHLIFHPEPVRCDVQFVVGLVDLSALAWRWRVCEERHLNKAADEESPPSAEVVQRSPQRLWCIPEHAQTPVAWDA
jgi:hypothetical protein